MSERAGERTTGGVNPIEPQPATIPQGLGTRLGSIVFWAVIVAVLIYMIWHFSQAA